MDSGPILKNDADFEFGLISVLRSLQNAIGILPRSSAASRELQSATAQLNELDAYLDRRARAAIVTDFADAASEVSPLAPLARGIIHPADPPRGKVACTVPEGIVSYVYAPPERRRGDKAIAIVPSLWKNKGVATIAELEQHFQQLGVFLADVNTIEAAEHHAQPWGEPRPDLVEEIVRAVVFAIASGTRDGAAGAVRAILEKEVWQAET